MQLYYFPIAPNPTRVRLYLAEKRAAGLQIDIREMLVDLRSGEHRKAEHMERNPFGKLPVLELDEGGYLTESLAIIEYLEELYPQPSLLGTTPLERARVRELERIAELGALIPAALCVHATNSPLGWPPNPGLARHYEAILPNALQVLDEYLADGRPFLAGTAPTIADCTLAAGLNFARFGRIDIMPDLENLARWDVAYRQREAVRHLLDA